ncbi:MAG TPA: trigger factor [Streptosporangiaceae bacterium]|nr:trigger factor [Streptosporangiaceae bacterium]
MKTDVEELSPTRVKLTIEVPFEELKSSLDKAYREVARQVRVPGFRPGRVPPRIIDQRFGRGMVLEQAVNDAVPQFYGQALQDNEVFALGQPDLEITRLDDGKELAFTAEVDVRPKFEIPDLNGLPVTVDDAVVTPDEVEEYIGSLRERFASLTGAERPVEDGDYTSIDLSASVDGEPVEDAQASGLSYEVGSGSLLDGLDEALVGMSAGESKMFTAELAGGEHGGEQADVTVTVHSVKVKELPELDDEFAQSASEFDTLGEFRAGTRSQLETVKRMQQARQARERALDALLAKIDIPLPDSMVDSEVEMRRQSLDEQLERAGTTMDAYLQSANLTAEQLEAGRADAARRSVKAGFVLDQLVLQENLNIEQDELNAFVIEQAYRMGVQPDRLARELAEHGQIGSVVAEVLRGKALSIITERATVTDEAGQPVDVAAALRPDQDQQAQDEQGQDEQAQDEQAQDEQAEPAEDAAEEQPADGTPAGAAAGPAGQPEAASDADEAAQRPGDGAGQDDE